MSQVQEQRRRVRVWFGPHPIADKTGSAEVAADYADAMERRFPGLRVTNDAVPSAEQREVVV